jgi:hypothetical protein
VADPSTKYSVVDRTEKLAQEIGASPVSLHLLRIVRSLIHQKVCHSIGDQRSTRKPMRYRSASLTGSVIVRAIEYRWRDEGRDFSGDFQHRLENGCGTSKEVELAVLAETC